MATGVTGATAANTGRTSAASGYGSGGYGEGAYGGTSTSTSVAVVTHEATDITTDSAVLEGELTDLGGASNADVGFEYRVKGASTWQTTATKQLSSIGQFTESVSGLQTGTDYEFRAVASGDSGTTDSGSTATFTTLQSTSNVPLIDSMTASEAGRPDPHAKVTVVWNVSDADGDLDTVNIDVADSNGAVQSVTWTVNGAAASDVDSFEISDGDGKTFDVTLTVTDAAGQSVSETQSVTA